MHGKVKLKTIEHFDSKKNRLEGEIANLEGYISSLYFNLKTQLENEYSIYIIGNGSKPLVTYSDLKKMDGISVLYIDFMGSRFFKLFRRVIAGEAGLVKIDNLEQFNFVWSLLSHQALAEVLIISNKYQEDLIEYVKGWKTSIRNWLIEKHNFLYIMIDGDNYESITGVYGLAIKGEDENKSLNEIFNTLLHT